jgi:hypothetical protein
MPTIPMFYKHSSFISLRFRVISALFDGVRVNRKRKLSVGTAPQRMRHHHSIARPTRDGLLWSVYTTRLSATIGNFLRISWYSITRPKVVSATRGCGRPQKTSHHSIPQHIFGSNGLFTYFVYLLLFKSYSVSSFWLKCSLREFLEFWGFYAP